jgi:isochorismate synthase EntC
MDSQRLATVTIPAPDLRPDAFLGQLPGARRGFWARGDRWVAHRGVGAEIVIDGPPSGDDRFAAVARRARSLAENPVLAPGATRAPRVRFYGGFSFRDGHVAAGSWAGFARARFVVPELELEGDASGDAWLRARARAEPGREDDTLARLRHLAEAARAELTSSGETPSREGPAVPGEVETGGRALWEDAVEGCLAAIREGRISKAVLARTLSITLDRRIDPVDVVMHLWLANRGSHVFLFEPEPDAALVGAAPETVATLRDGVFHATAVAGSIRRGGSPREQAELAARLLASDKDRAEQRIALDDMIARLSTVAQQIRSDPQPHVLTLARIQHLETEIRPACRPVSASSISSASCIRRPRCAACRATPPSTSSRQGSRSSAAGMPAPSAGSTRRGTACSLRPSGPASRAGAGGACSPAPASWKDRCRPRSGRRRYQVRADARGTRGRGRAASRRGPPGGGGERR